jgi:hypothetical protein
MHEGGGKAWPPLVKCTHYDVLVCSMNGRYTKIVQQEERGIARILLPLPDKRSDLECGSVCI